MSARSDHSYEERGCVPPIPFPFVPYDVQRELMKKVGCYFNLTLVCLCHCGKETKRRRVMISSHSCVGGMEGCWGCSECPFVGVVDLLLDY